MQAYSISIINCYRAIELYIEEQALLKKQLLAVNNGTALPPTQGTTQNNRNAPQLNGGITNAIVKRAADEYKEVRNEKNPNEVTP